MKLLIVDDDRYTREGILSSLPLEELGISNVMQTHDGRTALEIVRWFCPDFIITDICMPRMNGMEFASAVRRIQPECLLIFITGFAEIDYLKQAIELSAVAFVEKPLKPDELLKAVESAIKKHQERVFAQQHTESLKKLRRQKLASLLTRTDKDMQEVCMLCEKLGYPLSGHYQCLAITTKQPDLQEVIETLEGICSHYGFDAVTEIRENRQLHMVLASKRQTGQARQQLYDALLSRYPDLRIGEGFPVNAIERCAESRKAACLMLEKAFYDDVDQVYYFSRPEQSGVLSLDVYTRFVRMLEDDRTGLCAWLDTMLAEVIQKKADRVENLRTLMYAVSKELYRRYPELSGMIYGITNSSELEEYIYSVTRAEQFRTFLRDIFTELDKLDEATSRFTQIVRDAKNYIAQHLFQPDLGLQEIASQVNFSPAYLNVVFRTETGMTIKQYLIECRIHEAKRLLRDPKIRITEIALRCGYSNSNYFAKAFKEMTGLTPGEYREQKS